MTDTLAPQSSPASPAQRGRLTALLAALERLIPGRLAGEDRNLHRDIIVLGALLALATAIVFVVTTSWQWSVPRDSTKLAPVFWMPALQLVFGSYHVPGPVLIAPLFAVWLVLRLREAPGRAVRARDDSDFAGLKRPSRLAGHTHPPI